MKQDNINQLESSKKKIYKRKQELENEIKKGLE